MLDVQFDHQPRKSNSTLVYVNVFIWYSWSKSRLLWIFSYNFTTISSSYIYILSTESNRVTFVSNNGKLCCFVDSKDCCNWQNCRFELRAVHIWLFSIDFIWLGIHTHFISNSFENVSTLQSNACWCNSLLISLTSVIKFIILYGCWTRSPNYENTANRQKKCLRSIWSVKHVVLSSVALTARDVKTNCSSRCIISTSLFYFIH